MFFKCEPMAGTLDPKLYTLNMALAEGTVPWLSQRPCLQMATGTCFGSSLHGLVRVALGFKSRDHKMVCGCM